MQAESDDVPRRRPAGPRRILLSVHVDTPEGGDPIDTGALRGAIDPDGKRIRARLWLNSEQGRARRRPEARALSVAPAAAGQCGVAISA